MSTLLLQTRRSAELTTWFLTDGGQSYAVAIPDGAQGIVTTMDHLDHVIAAERPVGSYLPTALTVGNTTAQSFPTRKRIRPSRQKDMTDLLCIVLDLLVTPAVHVGYVLYRGTVLVRKMFRRPIGRHRRQSALWLSCWLMILVIAQS